MVQAIEAVNSGNITTMTSIEIAKLTEKRHDHVIRDIESLLNALDLPLPNFGDTYIDSQGKRQRCYKLDKELTLNLISGYNPKLRQAIIRKWQELEGGNKPRTYEQVMKEALMLADQRIQEMEEQALLDRPKVTFATAVEGSISSIKVEDWVKSIQPTLKESMGRNKAFAWLRQEGFLMESNYNKPYQHWVDQKLFEVKQTIKEIQGENRIFFTTLVTGKGQLYLLDRMRRMGLTL